MQAALVASLLGATLLGCGGDDPDWRSAPVVPSLDGATGETVDETLARGAELGDRPDVFIKVGDSLTSNPAFLQGFGCGKWSPGEHRDLEPTVSYFSARRLPGNSDVCSTANSFARHSAAALHAHVLVWPRQVGRADDPACRRESPLACELPVSARPAYAIILIGTNNIHLPFDPLPGLTDDLGAIIDDALAAGVVPVLSTLPPQPPQESRLERVNAAIFELAQSRHVPIINLWRAVEPLPNHGVGADEIHLSRRGSICVMDCQEDCGSTCRIDLTPRGLEYGSDHATWSCSRRLRLFAPPPRRLRPAEEVDRHVVGREARERLLVGEAEARR